MDQMESQKRRYNQNWNVSIKFSVKILVYYLNAHKVIQSELCTSTMALILFQNASEFHLAVAAKSTTNEESFTLYGHGY